MSGRHGALRSCVSRPSGELLGFAVLTPTYAGRASAFAPETLVLTGAHRSALGTLRPGFDRVWVGVSAANPNTPRPAYFPLPGNQRAAAVARMPARTSSSTGQSPQRAYGVIPVCGVTSTSNASTVNWGTRSITTPR